MRGSPRLRRGDNGGRGIGSAMRGRPLLRRGDSGTNEDAVNDVALATMPALSFRPQGGISSAKQCRPLLRRGDHGCQGNTTAFTEQSCVLRNTPGNEGIVGNGIALFRIISLISFISFAA
jgi:hypothetical protein